MLTSHAEQPAPHLTEEQAEQLAAPTLTPAARLAAEVANEI